MANYNKVILVGRLTRDPQMSYLPSQTAVVDFGLAISHNWRGQDGQKKEEVCFVECQLFGRPAETFNQYMAKGRGVLIEGRLRFETWEGKDGGKRSKHKVFVERFQFMDSAPRTGAPPAQRPEQAAPAQQPSSRQVDEPPAGQYDHGGADADDIPF